MKRREFLLSAAATAGSSRLPVPIFRIMDGRARIKPETLRHFNSVLWPEAIRDFKYGGIDLQVTEGPGEVRHTAGDQPIFIGLRRGVLNLVLTDTLPLYWDNARALAGITTIHEGFHLCLIALRYAHGDQVAFLSVNTCVHEIMHALLQDVFLGPPKLHQAGSHEFRVDWYATRMWLFHEGATVRHSAASYLRRIH